MISAYLTCGLAETLIYNRSKAEVDNEWFGTPGDHTESELEVEV